MYAWKEQEPRMGAREYYGCLETRRDQMIEQRNLLQGSLNSFVVPKFAQIP